MSNLGISSQSIEPVVSLWLAIVVVSVEFVVVNKIFLLFAFTGSKLCADRFATLPLVVGMFVKFKLEMPVFWSLLKNEEASPAAVKLLLL